MAAMTLPIAPPASGVQRIRPSGVPRVIGGGYDPSGRSLQPASTWMTESAASRSQPVVRTRSAGLPQLDPIALRIGDPAESTDTLHVATLPGQQSPASS